MEVRRRHVTNRSGGGPAEERDFVPRGDERPGGGETRERDERPSHVVRRSE